LAQFAFPYVYGKHKDKTIGFLAALVMLSFFSYAIETEENLYRTRRSGTLGPFSSIVEAGHAIEVASCVALITFFALKLCAAPLHPRWSSFPSPRLAFLRRDWWSWLDVLVCLPSILGLCPRGALRIEAVPNLIWLWIVVVVDETVFRVHGPGDGGFLAFRRSLGPPLPQSTKTTEFHPIPLSSFFSRCSAS
jgi:hypothetical protein